MMKGRLATAFAVLVGVAVVWGMSRPRELPGPLVAPLREPLATMKGVGIAMENWVTAKSGDYPQCGGELLSWRVRLLPFIGHRSEYRKLLASTPSERRDLIASFMPDLYRTLNTPPGWTRVRVFAGPGTAFDPHQRMTKQRVAKDRRATTIIAVMVGPDRAIPWWANRPLPFDPKQPAAALQSLGRTGDYFPVLFADGHADILPRDIDPQRFAAMLVIADGEDVNPAD